MSRSFKHHPYARYGPGARQIRRAKREANRKVRRCRGAVPSGGAYRKLYNSRRICDGRHWCPLWRFPDGRWLDALIARMYGEPDVLPPEVLEQVRRLQHRLEWERWYRRK